VCTIGGDCHNPLTLQYSATGNILYKSDVGHYPLDNEDNIYYALIILWYKYQPTQPHAVTSIGGGSLTLQYDVAGRLTNDSFGRTVQSYTYFDKPVSVSLHKKPTLQIET
jgi:hypothetical protein